MDKRSNFERIMGVLSCPRLGFMDFMGNSLVAFLENNIPLRLVYGAFWDHAMQSGMELAVADGREYVITTDYDTVFESATVKRLVELMDANPQADAICAMQMGRFSGLLASTETGEIAHKELMEDLCPVESGHFGLTIIRISSLVEVPKPWFLGIPNSEGSWASKTDKTDPDIYFWKNWRQAGKNLYLAPRLVVGHLELLLKWPDLRMDGIYQTVGNYNETGLPPADVWR